MSYQAPCMKELRDVSKLSKEGSLTSTGVVAYLICFTSDGLQPTSRSNENSVTIFLICTSPKFSVFVCAGLQLGLKTPAFPTIMTKKLNQRLFSSKDENTVATNKTTIVVIKPIGDSNQSGGVSIYSQKNHHKTNHSKAKIAKRLDLEFCSFVWWGE